MPPLLGYWGIRGLAQPIRYVLEYAGEKYEFKNHSDSPKEAWAEDKLKLGIPFPNLPYYVDGDVKMGQSNAILRYVSRKHGLAGKTEKDYQEIDVLEGALTDLRLGWTKLCYMSQNFENDKTVYRTNVDASLKQFADYLGSEQYLVTGGLTYVDFVFFELLEGLLLLYEDLFDQFPTLKQYHQRIKGLKGVKEYLASKRNPEKFNSPIAKFGG